VLLDVDKNLSALAIRYDAIYTRYADDLAFSGSGNLPTRAEIADALRVRGLTLHPAKYEHRKSGQAFYVTGYSVTDAAPHAPRPLKRRLRQELHYVKKYGLADHVGHEKRPSLTAEHDRIAGQIKHVQHVDKKAGERLSTKWNARPKEKDGVFARSSTQTAEPVVLLVDDSDFKVTGRPYSALGVIVLREHAATAIRLKEIQEDLLLDPTMPRGKRALIRSKGLHFSDLPLDFRKVVIDAAARAPVRAHIVFEPKAGPKKTQMALLLRTSLKWRLANCRGKRVSVVFEVGEYIRKGDALRLVEGLVSELPTHERPLRLEEVRVAGKLEEPCLALADVFLGAWQQFACGNEPERKTQRDRDEALFRTLEPKIGTIYNRATRDLFTTRRRFERLPASPGPNAPAG
jgi:hypothetical protein